MTSRIDNSLQLWVPRLTGTAKDLKEAEHAGPFKPSYAKWTSTAYRSKNNPELWQSAWSEWLEYEMPEWLQKRGILYKVKPGARILNLDTDKEALRIARDYGMNVNKSIDLMLRGMPWNKIREDYDAVHHIPSGRSQNMMMSSWDVESTAWFDENYLQKIEVVNIDTGDVDAEKIVKDRQEAWLEKFGSSQSKDK